MNPCVPLAIKTIMIVLFEILTLFRFKAIRSSWLTLNEIMIALIAKGTQGIIGRNFDKFPKRGHLIEVVYCIRTYYALNDLKGTLSNLLSICHGNFLIS